MKRAAIILVLLLPQIAGCGESKSRQVVRVAVSQTVSRTGLVQRLASRFSLQSKAPVEISVVPDVIAAAGAGSADVAIVESAAAVEALRRQNRVQLSGRFAQTTYVIVGPARDPSAVRTAGSAIEAFRRVGQKKARFVSPVDLSAAEERERIVWSVARSDPKKNRHYTEAHGAADGVLMTAAAKGAYTLTYAAAADSLDAKQRVLLSGGPLLHDDLFVVLIDPQTRKGSKQNALWFVEWLMSYRGREVVQSFRTPDGQGFEPAAE